MKVKINYTFFGGSSSSSNTNNGNRNSAIPPSLSSRISINNSGSFNLLIQLRRE